MLLCHETGLPNLIPHLVSDLCEEGKMFHTFFFLTYSHDLVSGYCAYLACHWRTLLFVNCYVLSGGMSGGIFSFHHHFHYWSRSLNLKTHTSLAFQFFDLNVLFITFT